MLNRRFFYAFVNNLLVVVCVIAIAIIWMCLKNVNVDDEMPTEPESSVAESSPSNNDIQVTVEPSEPTVPEQTTLPEETQSPYPPIEYSKDWSSDEEYMLAKIAMAEAEGEPLETKVLVILTVLNRVNSDEFPNTIKDVLFQTTGGVYQFTPMVNGRWDRIEPNEECWDALRIVKEATCDYSFGALYFESYQGENWHSRNLTLVCESGIMQFYK